MRRATDIRSFEGRESDKIVGTVTLSYEDRYRRRIKMRDDKGEKFLLDLPKAVQMLEGDILLLEGGGMIEVIAAKEDVLDIICKTKTESLKIAWHLGNRHISVQILESGRLRIIYDHVLKEMVEGLGAKTKRHFEIFSPEKGAYGAIKHRGQHSHG